MAINQTVRAIIEAASTSAAEKAVREVFLNLGVDVTDKKALVEHQHDLIFLRLFRTVVERKLLWVLLSALCVFLGGIGAIFVYLIRQGAL